MRLIDADALKAHVNSLSTHWLNDWSTIGVLAAIDRQITVDAVHGRWISVEDRPPTEDDADDNGFVVAYTTENKKIIARWTDVRRFNEFVTHWMPLPQPPKGE